MCGGGVGPFGDGSDGYGAQHAGTTHYLDQIDNFKMDGRPVTSDMKQFGLHQPGDRQMFFFPMDAIARIAKAKAAGSIDAHGNRVIQRERAPASRAASASSKPKGRRQESSAAKGADRRGDLLGGGRKKASTDIKNKERLGKKTLLGA